MKKNRLFLAAAVLALNASFVGCKESEEQKFRCYDDGAAYTSGNFICDGAAVKRIVIDWFGGNVEMEQTASGKVEVFEEDNDLPEEKRLHTYLDEGVLRVKYCRSGYRAKIDETQKNLQVDIPKGISVEINAASANVYLGTLETDDLCVKTDTGCVETENLTCRSAEIETERGYIGIGALSAKRAEIDSDSGDIHTVLPTCDVAEIETDRGAVTVYLQGDVNALIAFSSHSGALHTDRKYEKRNSGYFFAMATEKDETYALSVRTESGNLTVR